MNLNELYNENKNPFQDVNDKIAAKEKQADAEHTKGLKNIADKFQSAEKKSSEEFSKKLRAKDALLNKQGVAEDYRDNSMYGQDADFDNMLLRREAKRKGMTVAQYKNYLEKQKQDQEHELNIGSAGRAELKQKADELAEIKREKLRNERLADEEVAFQRAETVQQRKDEMQKIADKYKQDLTVIDKEHRNNMESIRTGNNHEINKIDKDHAEARREREHSSSESDKDRAEREREREQNRPKPEKPKPVEMPEPEEEPRPRPSKPTYQQYNAPAQAGLSNTKPPKPSKYDNDDVTDVEPIPNKPLKYDNDDVTDGEPKPNKPLSLKEKITVVKDPADATSIQQTGGITQGSVYAGKPLPQSLQQKLDGKTNTARAVDAKGRTQQQWMKLVKAKFPDAKIMQSKMFNGPVFAMLSNGRKLSWNKVEQGVEEAAQAKTDDNTLAYYAHRKAEKQKTADRKEQRTQTQQQARDAFGNMFGGGNPADKLKIKEQGRFAGDTPVNLGDVTMKSIQVGDTVMYIGQKAEVVAMSKDRKRARITIEKGMGGVTQDVNTSDLKQLGKGVAKDVSVTEVAPTAVRAVSGAAVGAVTGIGGALIGSMFGGVLGSVAGGAFGGVTGANAGADAADAIWDKVASMFGSDKKATQYGIAHAQAAQAGEQKFQFNGKTYPVTLKPQEAKPAVDALNAVKKVAEGAEYGIPDETPGHLPGGPKMTFGQFKKMWPGVILKRPSGGSLAGSVVADVEGWMNSPKSVWEPLKGVAEAELDEIDRRGFLKGLGAAAATAAVPAIAQAGSGIDYNRVQALHDQTFKKNPQYAKEWQAANGARVRDFIKSKDPKFRNSATARKARLDMTAKLLQKYNVKINEGQFDLINDDDFYEYNVNTKEIVKRISGKHPIARQFSPMQKEWAGRDADHKIVKGMYAKYLKPKVDEKVSDFLPKKLGTGHDAGKSVRGWRKDRGFAE